MRLYYLSIFIILLSTIVSATTEIAEKIRCDPLDKDPAFYENLVLNSGVAHPEGWNIEKVHATNCMIHKGVNVVVDYVSLPSFSDAGLNYKLKLFIIIEDEKVVNENEVINLFAKLPKKVRKFENNPAVKLFLDVTGVSEVNSQGKSFNIVNPNQGFQTKTAGYQNDFIDYSLEKENFQGFALVTPQLIENKELFSPGISKLAQVVEFEEKVGIEKIEMKDEKITLFEARSCAKCKSTLTLQNSEVVGHALDYTLEWQNFPEVKQVKALLINEIIPRYSKGCKLQPFSTTPSFDVVFASRGATADGWGILFTLQCRGEDREYWREITFNVYKDGRYENFNIHADEEVLMKAVTKAMKKQRFTTYAVIGAIILILLLFFLIRRWRKYG